jgi:prepilin-type N-terminal cleavage/methylation domain-containing protein
VLFRRTASRDGSRSDPKLDAALRCRAFTLVELLVVVALVGMWAAMLATGLAHTRPNVRLIQCLSNKHQLALACSMYSHDWNDYLVPNAPASDTRGWCSGMENWYSAGPNTNLNYYTTNCLAPYVANQCKAYKCPGDTIPSDNGDRIRSTSMNGQMTGAIPTPGGNSYNPGWRIYKKVSDLTSPTPAMGWVFCDESMYSLNDGFLQMGLNSFDYPDVPAAYHGGANCFSFVDGHAEAHKWIWGGTYFAGLRNCPYAKNVTGYHRPSSGVDVDFMWLGARTSFMQ